MRIHARTTLLTIVLLGLLAVLPSSASAAVCSEFANQAAAQAAANTVDADNDGIYCETLPCPCSTASPPAPAPAPTPAPPPPVAPPPPAPSAMALTAGPNPAGCKRPKDVQRLLFSKRKYPNIRAHVLKAVADGWPKVMVVNRKGAPQRRNRLLDELMPTKAGFDRDEYPAAVGRGKANGASWGLIAGTDPVGWIADVAYVPSSENRSHDSSLGAKLRRLCNGTRFRYAFS